MVKKIVNLHGISIFLNSQIGQGSKFILKF